MLQFLPLGFVQSSLFFCRYLTCVSQTMRTLQPFGDVPEKLSQQLRQSFVATRTFNQALSSGKKILNRIVKVSWDFTTILVVFDFISTVVYPFLLPNLDRPSQSSKLTQNINFLIGRGHPTAVVQQRSSFGAAGRESATFGTFKRAWFWGWKQMWS